MVNDIVNRLARCERETFIVDEFRGRPDAPPFTIVTGSMPVMVSAPHAVTQMREGKPKPSEDYTGSIALEIARKLDCHAIVATRTSDGDPNWDDFATCAYKQALVAHVSRHEIALVLDLHGMIAASPALAAIGTNDGMTTRFRPELDEAALAILNNALAAENRAARQTDRAQWPLCRTERAHHRERRCGQGRHLRPAG